MSAAARLLLAEYVASRRWAAPLLFLAAGVIVLYAQPPNPVLSTAGTAAAWLLPSQCWLTLSFLNTEDAGERQAVIAAIGARAFFAARVLGLAALALVSTLLTVGFPVITGRFERPAHLTEIGVILLASFGCAAAGSGFTALFTEPSVRSRATPALGIVAFLVLAIPLGLSPAISTAAAMDHTGAGRAAGHLASPLLFELAFATVALALSGVLWRRRE